MSEQGKLKILLLEEQRKQLIKKKDSLEKQIESINSKIDRIKSYEDQILDPSSKEQNSVNRSLSQKEKIEKDLIHRATGRISN